MNILGLHIGHDSSAALIRNGRIVADVAEERFTRIKHYAGLPFRSIDYCLKSQGLTMDQVDAVAIPTSGSVPELNFLLGLKGDREEKKSTPRKMLDFAHQLRRRALTQPPLYIKNFPISARTELVHVDHHRAHAASAFYTNPFRGRQLIVTIDGVGDAVSIALWRGENNKIEPLLRLPCSASIGWFYSNVTEALGWWHGDGEGKTMGLAPYGDYSKIQGILEPYHPRFENGQVIRSHDFGQPYFWNEAGAIQWHLEESIPIRELVQKHGEEAVAAEAQRVLEEQVQALIFPWMEKEKTSALTCSGGVFLNVKLNQRIWESGRVQHHHIYPNAGDSGLAVGAALDAYYQFQPSAPVHAIDNLYWGPEYSDAEIEKILQLRHLEYQKVEDVASYAAEKLAQNKILAWFQGRMESGPRALGNRSILMSANKPENKDIINARVKFREAFRPFCPSLLWERKEDYLEKARDEFFMITSFTCQKSKRDKVPAVVHADATLRPQTIKKDFNALFWKLLSEFEKRTGESLLLNTSFNIMGEPIVCDPREAIRCFYDNGLDCLVLGNYVLEKKA